MGETYPKIYLYKRIVYAKMFIDTHFSQPLDLDNIADEAAFSKFHFIRLFKTIYRLTPHQYLTRVRVEHAKALLATGLTVREVCFAVGFDSASSFTGLFKRIVGLPPSGYQQQQTNLRRETLTTPLKFIPNCFAEKNGWTKNSNFREAGA